MEDARQFNIFDAQGRCLCPACGFPGTFYGESYDERGGVIGSGICFCCLWEPGFDDCAAASGATESTILASLQRYRKGWTLLGPAWSGKPENIPSGWDGKQQLEHLFKTAPFVR